MSYSRFPRLLFLLFLLLILNIPAKGGFIRNMGQLVMCDGTPANEVIAYSDDGDVDVYLRSSGISYVFRSSGPEAPLPGPGQIPNAEQLAWRMDLNIAGANPNAIIEGVGEQSCYYNYYLESTCPDGITHVPAYSEYIYHDIYQGIDMRIYFIGGQLKYDFIVHPGANPDAIRLSCAGGQLQITDKTAVLSSPAGKVNDNCLKVMQSDTEIIPASFVSYGNEYGFLTGDYDKSRYLIIDPVIDWISYYGGNNNDAGKDVAFDGNGNIYIIAITQSSDFPTEPGCFQESKSGTTDWLISKMGIDQDLKWVTYCGSSGDEHLFRVLYNANKIWVCGASKGVFPVTDDAFAGWSENNYDAAIAQFDDAGQRLYATQYGLSQYQCAADMALDKQGNLYVAGRTYGPVQVSDDAMYKSHSFAYDGFLIKFNSSNKLVYASYLNGNQDDLCESIAIDSKGNIILAGFTRSSNFPAKNPYQPKLAGDFDAFIIKMDDKMNILWATYFGGDSRDYLAHLTLDRFDNIYISGYTLSDNFPVSDNPYKEELDGLLDSFLARFSPDGDMEWATYIGGSHDEGVDNMDGQRGGLLIGPDEIISMTINSKSSDIKPMGTDKISEYHKNQNSVVYKRFSLAGEQVYSSYMSGDSYEYAGNMDVDSFGRIAIVGTTASSDFPVTSDARQKKKNNLDDTYIIMLNRAADQPDSCDETGFEYNEFSNSSLLSLIGRSWSYDEYIRLTGSRMLEAGAVWYKNYIPVLNGFKAGFRFRLSTPQVGQADESSHPGADGIAYVIQNSSLSEIGRKGGGLGYDGINNAMAIEIDLFNNDDKQIANYNDPNGNHIALMTAEKNENLSVIHSDYTLAVNSDIMEIQSDGTIYELTMEYDAEEGNFSVYLNEDNETPELVFDYGPVYIQELIDLHENEWAFMGITAATGSSCQIHDILSWYVCPKPTDSQISGIADFSGQSDLSCTVSKRGGRQWLTINKSMPASGYIRLFDLMGRPATEYDLHAGIGVQEIALDNLPAAAYLYTISSGTEIIGGKILLH